MKHVVIGGGIAGVCCVEELCRLRPNHEVVLVSASTVLKGVDSVIKISKTIEEVKVTEKALTSLRYPNLTILQDVVVSLDTAHKVVVLQSGKTLDYDKLCICTGARPKELGFKHERLITLRDMQSVEVFAQQLAGARRIAIIGNGAIALELIGAVRDMEVVWVLKHGHIGDAFFDLDAAEFLLGVLQQQTQVQQQHHQLGTHSQQQQQQPVQQVQQQVHMVKQQKQHSQTGSMQQQHRKQQDIDTGQHGSASAAGGARGHAAGPKWLNQLPGGQLPPHVVLEKNALVQGVSPNHASQPADAVNSSEGNWPLNLQLSNGQEVGVDLAVQAIGVEPATDWLPAELQQGGDGGILANCDLESSLPGVYAAGDCCTVKPTQQTPHWFQMRLWTQARLMGNHAAACMAGAQGKEVLSCSMELFSHVTRFLGKKVVLLGLYNGHKLHHELEQDMVMYTRVLDEGTPDATFVRVLLLRGRMQGAVLIGETGLEETFENLILDGLDLSQFGPRLLDPDIELDHVFD